MNSSPRKHAGERLRKSLARRLSRWPIGRRLLSYRRHLATIEPVCLAEENHRFAARVIREAREAAPDPDVQVTFTEAAVHFFIKGVHRPMFAHYVRYALGSLERGENLLSRYVPEPAEVSSYLDVGCAYGGAPVAMARCGVGRAVGFEYDARLLKLARILAREHGVSDQVSFVGGDLCAVEDIEPLGTFALVTCIDVLEHVLDPEAAIVNLAALVEPGGTAVVDVPNPQGVDPIRRDPHHHIFGSVLLERDDAIHVFEDENPGSKRYTVGYFHPLEWYLERLEDAGFEVEIMDEPPVEPDAVAETLAALDGLRDELAGHAAGWPEWRTALVSDAVDAFFAEIGDYRDLARRDPGAFQRRHAVGVYHLRCRR